MGQIGELWIKIGAKLDDLDKGLSDVQKATTRIGESLAKVGKNLTKYVTTPILGIGIAAFKMSNDFNQAMSNVATLIPRSTARVLELKKSVQDLAIDTGKSTTDIARGLYEVISAFQDSADTAKILEINVKAAAAGILFA